nr:Chain C, AtRing1a proximal binding site peptide [Arabidopsis thaliana]5Y21_D Chain D, AtRing1a proximal binding site peptide [Arabidopsis thaliana]
EVRQKKRRKRSTSR